MNAPVLVLTSLCLLALVAEACAASANVADPAIASGNVLPTATSQIAFPSAVTTAVYDSALYAGRGQNTSVPSFADDNVFSDGTTYQLAALAGDTTSGYTATLTVGVAA